MHLREGSLGLLGLLALMAPYGSVYAETFTAPGTTGSGGPSFSQGWNASSPDLGPGVTCVGCGVPLIPEPTMVRTSIRLLKNRVIEEP